MIQWLLTTPVDGAFTGDTPITGCTLQSCRLDFVAQTATAVVTSIGGPSGGVLTWQLVIAIPSAEATTLQGQLKTAVAAALGTSFQ
jgi:hypothetical protein